ncbi:molybdate ABC transporter substrate-binding protein [Campylobacter sp. 19-13652]|uniref:molybdate ABC transporter substrate-binding protein n=1 Tax=Campylobacter sp. 19-13652 TaxID=2840180 RepID=UPI001C761D03|nr:molybdate ABC transporter substrate-binding protein [Campylobacter sp. 19-13652]BCX78912.1 molybdate ABC transporter substrate-binding protein [Campylobacter sp. 19-13652]
MNKFIFKAAFAALMALSLQAKEVVVYAAANTTYAFPELIKKFNTHHKDTQIKLTLGSSGALSTQIRNGANADIFLAANMDFVNKLADDGFSETKPVVYARGKLALFSLERIALNDGIKSVLNAKSISIANPKTAPYGTASIEALKNAKILTKVEPKIIYAQKISETLSQALSAADVGFIAASALYSPKMTQYKEGVNYIFINSELYSPIDQGIVLLNHAKDSKEAREFYEFLLGDEARAIFAKFGYDLP